MCKVRDGPSNEKKLMKLHTKFAVMKRLDETEMKIQQELAYTKARMGLREREERIEEEWDLTDEEKKARKDLQDMTRKAGDKNTDLDNKETTKLGMSAEERDEMIEEEEARTRQIFDPGRK